MEKFDLHVAVSLKDIPEIFLEMLLELIYICWLIFWGQQSRATGSHYIWPVISSSLSLSGCFDTQPLQTLFNGCVLPSNLTHWHFSAAVRWTFSLSPNFCHSLPPLPRTPSVLSLYCQTPWNPPSRMLKGLRGVILIEWATKLLYSSLHNKLFKWILKMHLLYSVVSFLFLFWMGHHLIQQNTSNEKDVS